MFQISEEQPIFSTVKVGERGQIVIPKETRDLFNIKPGDSLLILANKKNGIIILKADKIKELAKEILKKIDNFENNE
ncbi:MAG: AbrB/MazE/SpoVT family DNA-binding domain-containing protein [Actinomycetota bacterium]|nr:AbrB/MazE/SpoVT family DNA-binding domain-containing protein [Actinomycetota bacterium]